VGRWKIFDPTIWETIQAAVAPSTQRGYHAIFSLFLDYITQIGRTVETVNVDEILTFFQDYVDDRKSASTIRQVYSSLLYHFRLHGCETILRNPLILMFVKGAQNLAPPPRQKIVVWDPEIPLNLLKSRPRPSEFLPAAREALLLLLLATGIRVDCASKMAARMVTRPTFCQIPYLLARKTGFSEPQRVKCLLSDERLCPVRAILHYLDLAKQIRKENEVFLFVSSTGTRAHKDTLRRWVVDLLQEAGIDATAGSCRSASTSAAFSRNDPIDEILKSAGWAQESTFRKFYKRQVLKIEEGLNLLVPLPQV
jgi:site-specific recombinase XerD